jgi:hypothetical protein
MRELRRGLWWERFKVPASIQGRCRPHGRCYLWRSRAAAEGQQEKQSGARRWHHETFARPSTASRKGMVNEHRPNATLVRRKGQEVPHALAHPHPTRFHRPHPQRLRFVLSVIHRANDGQHDRIERERRRDERRACPRRTRHVPTRLRATPRRGLMRGMRSLLRERRGCGVADGRLLHAHREWRPGIVCFGVLHDLPPRLSRRAFRTHVRRAIGQASS